MYRAACAVLEDRVRQNVRAAADARAAEAALADAAAAGGVGQAVQLPQAVALTASHCVDLAWALARVGHCREAPALMDLLAVRWVHEDQLCWIGCCTRALLQVLLCALPTTERMWHDPPTLAGAIPCVPVMPHALPS